MVILYSKEFIVSEELYAFDETDDLIDICRDNVFKAVFTKNTIESQGALSKLLSAIIDKDLSVIAINVNEPPVDDIRDKQIRFDINCRAVITGELINVEMFINSDKFEPIRLEYYVGKLFTGQDIKGKDKGYNNLKEAYQISFLRNNRIFGDDEYFHSFEYFDPKRIISLGGKSRIITLELTKIEKLLEKPVEVMTSKERWAIFFRYLRDKNKKTKINEIVKYEEGIAMANAVLDTITKDEVERARLMSELKYELDHQSQLTNAKIEGKIEGKIEVARNMKRLDFPIDQIMEITGLSIEDISDLIGYKP
jgi:predicted transposase/invertase (TIGR01784 family)